MIEIADLLKPTEAAVVSGVELKIVHHAIDRAIPARLIRSGREKGISAEACFYIAFYHFSAGKLTASERLSAILDIDSRVQVANDSASRWTSLREHCTVRHDFLNLDLRGFWTDTFDRWSRYQEARDAVTSDVETLGGAAVFAGTRIPVHDVAASVTAGIGMSRISAAYPSLTEEQIELAALYARANPLRGRPPGRKILSDAKVLSRRVVKRRQAKA